MRRFTKFKVHISKSSRYLLPYAATLVLSAWAGEIVTPAQRIDDAHRVFNGGSEKIIACIRAKATPKIDLITHAASIKNVERIAPYLDRAFDQYKFSPLERALFISQVIEETGGFSTLNESKKNYGRPGLDSIGQMVNSRDDDDRFKCNPKKGNSANFGPFRGRGLIQVSRCDNYFSVLHSVNQMHDGKEPLRGSENPVEWRADWKYQIGTKKEKREKKGKTVYVDVPVYQEMGSCCPREHWQRMMAKYQQDFGRPVDPYGVFDDPLKIGMTGAEFDNGRGGKIASEQLMVESSIAFWRGGCAATTHHVVDRERLESFERCKDLKDPDYTKFATRCILRCVNPGSGDWEKRQRWLKIAMDNKCF